MFLKEKVMFRIKTLIDKAVSEYKIFRKRQDKEYISEFDKQVEKYIKG